MYDHACSLLTKTVTVNNAGDSVETLTQTATVFCRVNSASFKEKDMAESRGEKAELTITLADMAEYNDERFLSYNGKTYEIIDTYFTDKNKEIRLVVKLWRGR